MPSAGRVAGNEHTANPAVLLMVLAGKPQGEVCRWLEVERVDPGRAFVASGETWRIWCLVCQTIVC